MVKYVLGQSPNYWWPVAVRRPDPENPGAFIEHRFKALFIPEEQDAALARMEEIDKILTPRARAKAERESLADQIAGWGDIEDAEGNPVPFSRAALLAELQKPQFREAIYVAIGEAVNGRAASLGN